MIAIQRLAPRLPLLGGLLTLGLLMACPAARAQSGAHPYLAGKTLTIVVNQSAGQQRDLEARLYAEFLGRDLPGHPTIKVVDMGGAAGLKATRYVYKAARPDGLTIGYLSQTLPTQQLLEMHHAAEVVLNLDLRKFAWIGSSGGAATVFYVTKKVPYKTAKDLLFGDNRKFIVKVGATRPGSTTFTGPALLVEVFHAPIKIITGYTAAERDLAMMQGELAGDYGRWSGIVTKNRDWFKSGFVRPLLSEGGPIPRADLDALGIKQPVPDVFDLVKNPKDTAFMHVALDPARWGSLLVAPPGTPKDRVAILRQGFDKLRQDPKFRAMAHKRKMDLNPISGATAEHLVADYLNSPSDQVRRYLNMVKKN